MSESTPQETAYQGPPPPRPTFYATQAQSMLASIEDMIQVAGVAASEGDHSRADTQPQLAAVIASMSRTAAVLDLAHALRQAGTTLASVLQQQDRGDGDSKIIRF